MHITTDRLVLKPLSLGDIDFLYDLDCNPLVYFYNSDNQPSKEETYDKYSKKISAMQENPDKRYILLVSTLSDGIPIGEVHFKLNWEENKEWEIGYYLHPDHWGKGYATEAVRAVLKYLFVDRNAHRIIAYCNANNQKSYGVMERVGMQKEGVNREVAHWHNEWCDYYTYSILDREYVIIDA